MTIYKELELNLKQQRNHLHEACGIPKSKLMNVVVLKDGTTYENCGISSYNGEVGPGAQITDNHGNGVENFVHLRVYNEDGLAALIVCLVSAISRVGFSIPKEYQEAACL